VGKQVQHKLAFGGRMVEIGLCCYTRNPNDTVARVICPEFCPTYYTIP